MADSKVSDLTADSSPTTDDLVYTVNDPGGTPADRKATIANVLGAGLTAIRGLTSAANKIVRFTGSGTADLIDFLDEDDLASDSATAVASQQSIKAYVDSGTSPDSFVLGPGDLSVASGTRTVTSINQRKGVLSLPNGSNTYLDVPIDVAERMTGWTTWDAYAVIANAGAGSGDIVLRGDYDGWSDGDDLDAIATASTVVAALAQNIADVVKVASGIAVPADDFLSVRFGRGGVSPSDTLGNAVNLLAVQFKKAT